jgi:hypothetical protein
MNLSSVGKKNNMHSKTKIIICPLFWLLPFDADRARVLSFVLAVAF